MSVHVVLSALFLRFELGELCDSTPGTVESSPASSRPMMSIHEFDLAVGAVGVYECSQSVLIMYVYMYSTYI